MKSYSLFGVLGFGLAAFVAPSACTVTSTTINGGGTDGGDDTTLGTDDSGGSSSGSSSGSMEASSEASSSGSSSSGGGEAGGDAGACPNAPTIPGPDGGPSSCDECMKGHCCTQLLDCDSPDAGGGVVDDAGTTACEDGLACAVGLVSIDAGNLQNNIATCVGGDAAAAPPSLTALVACAMTNCATACQ